MDATETIPADLIPTKAACKLIPSPREGKTTSLATLYRWMCAGRLRWWTNGRYRLVSRAEVLGLLRPGVPPPAADGWAEAARRKRMAAEARRVLDRAGI